VGGEIANGDILDLWSFREDARSFFGFIGLALEDDIIEGMLISSTSPNLERCFAFFLAPCLLSLPDLYCFSALVP
jgi:hypothetical protein